ncbi:hypothetical protein BDR04DRAFT_338376 [Suillus decipiens]|nr:hypothetical protein BDR04DRAFT_338376 [Suillus decipiens]
MMSLLDPNSAGARMKHTLNYSLILTVRVVDKNEITDGLLGQRRTILCSATILEDIHWKLAGTTLIRPLVIKGLERAEDSAASKHDSERATTTRSSLPHHNSSRKTLIVPLKMHPSRHLNIPSSWFPSHSHPSCLSTWFLCHSFKI